MDTSKEYVKMCNCPEIQGSVFVGNGDGKWWRRDGNLIWLPRQDQLQKMLNWEVHKLVYRFDEFCRGSSNMYGSQGFLDAYGCGYSMEMLWLALVMSELHNKKWDGEIWK